MLTVYLDQNSVQRRWLEQCLEGADALASEARSRRVRIYAADDDILDVISGDVHTAGHAVW